MGAAGSPHANFQRAVERGNVLLAITVAKELGTLSLEDALALTEMLARVGDERFEPAAVRWLGRLAAERAPSLRGIQLAAEALSALPDTSALVTLRALARAR